MGPLPQFLFSEFIVQRRRHTNCTRQCTPLTYRHLNEGQSRKDFSHNRSPSSSFPQLMLFFFFHSESVCNPGHRLRLVSLLALSQMKRIRVWPQPKDLFETIKLTIGHWSLRLLLLVKIRSQIYFFDMGPTSCLFGVWAVVGKIKGPDNCFANKSIGMPHKRTPIGQMYKGKSQIKFERCHRC